MDARRDRRDLGPVRRVVVKLGSTTVSAGGLDALVDEMAALRSNGIGLAVVSSGAVAAGMAWLGLEVRPTELARVQALAAAGQAELMARWNASFGRHGTRCAQILLTHEDLADRTHFFDIRHTLEAVFDLGLVPVVNENDTVATEELRFGDNDRLAAALATVVGADLVVLLSDVDALYDRDPKDPAALPIREVVAIDDGLRSAAGRAGSAFGTGGMASKIQAAELAVEAGIPLLVAHGGEPGVLTRLLAGEPIGTRFQAPRRRVERRRHWIGFLSRLRGTVTVDEGAARALLERGSSLLAAGVRRVEGRFSRGDAVRIAGPDGAEVARGLVAYDSEQLGRIAGRRSDEVRALLGAPAVDPVVHRNDLLLRRSAEQVSR